MQTPAFMGPFKAVPPVVRRAADPGAVAGVPPGALPFQIQVQQQTSWCWAAVAASVTDYFHNINNTPVKSQCEIASDYASPSNCCSNPSAEGCDCAGVLDTVLDDNKHRQSSEGTIEFADIVAEIGTRKCPVCCKITWPIVPGGAEDPGGHYVVIMGCHADASQDVIVLDPLKESPHCGAFTFDGFKALGGGTWTDTIRTK